METSGTGRGPIQSVTPVHFSHQPPEREDSSVRSFQHDQPEFQLSEPVVITIDPSGDDYSPDQLPVFVYRERFSPHTSLPFITQKIAQETSYSSAANGPFHYRSVASAYQRAEESDLRLFTTPLPLNLRA